MAQADSRITTCIDEDWRFLMQDAPDGWAHRLRHVWYTAIILAPLTLAAIAAMKDLSRSVRIRDCSINAYGDTTDTSKRELTEPAVAGYPAGWLYNEHFKEMADIGNAALKLGKGNLKRGLKQILKRASA